MAQPQQPCSNSCSYLHLACTRPVLVKNRSWMREGLTGSYISLLNYWLLTDPGRVGLIAFSCIPNSESAMYPQIVQNSWSHRQLRGSQNETKTQEEKECNEEFSQNSLCIYIKKSLFNAAPCIVNTHKILKQFVTEKSLFYTNQCENVAKRKI